MPPEQPQSPQQPAATPTKKPVISTPAAILTGAVIVALAVIFTLGPKGKSAPTTQQQPADTTPTTVPNDVVTLRANDYVRGNKNADVLIFEYSDSDCPFCQQFHATMQQALSTYGNKLGWVYRFYPLSIHPNAYTEALALSCVGELGGNDAFWNYLDTVINITLNPDPKSNEALKTYATQEGINKAMFETCLKNDQSTAQIDADIAEAQKIGAKGTPFSVAMNTKTGEQAVIPGAVPFDYLKQTLDNLLK